MKKGLIYLKNIFWICGYKGGNKMIKCQICDGDIKGEKITICEDCFKFCISLLKDTKNNFVVPVVIEQTGKKFLTVPFAIGETTYYLPITKIEEIAIKKEIKK